MRCFFALLFIFFNNRMTYDMRSSSDNEYNLLIITRA